MHIPNKYTYYFKRKKIREQGRGKGGAQEGCHVTPLNRHRQSLQEVQGGIDFACQLLQLVPEVLDKLEGLLDEHTSCLHSHRDKVVGSSKFVVFLFCYQVNLIVNIILLAIVWAALKVYQ